MDPVDALGELRSRLSMTEVEVNIRPSSPTTTPSSESPAAALAASAGLRIIKEASMKKSRKNKNPTFRHQRKPLVSDSINSKLEGGHKDNMEVEKKQGPNGTEGPIPGAGFKSYSDYMRSLAAKYNNNE